MNKEKLNTIDIISSHIFLIIEHPNLLKMNIYNICAYRITPGMY